MPNIKADLETLRQARPYLRTALAILFYFRTGYNSMDEDYDRVDLYLDQLEEDVKTQK